MSNNSGMGTGRMKDGHRSTKEAVVTLLVWPRRDKKRRQDSRCFGDGGEGGMKVPTPLTPQLVQLAVLGRR